jgi:P4 family phage/plasmid primase-like protien
MNELPKGLPRTKEELLAKLRQPTEPNDYKPNLFSSFESWCDAEGNFNPALLAKDLTDNFQIKTDLTTDTLYLYDNDKGIYDKTGDARLRIAIDNALGPENRQHRTTETIYIVHSKTQQELQISPKIAVENGLLDVQTQTLEPFTPNEFVTAKIPVKYDRTAKCLAIEKFLAEVLEPDQIPIAQELIGYCLLRDYPIHTSFVLLGLGANGKSTFLNMVNAFLGPENCSHVTLQELCEGKFELAELYGKLANVCDDLPGDALKSVGNFKNLCGNAPILAQFKHKPPFTFLNNAKLLWACNKLPAASEDTLAFYRRFIILQFNRFFVGTKADIHLLDKLTTPQELSGLLNFALEGLTRVLKNSVFTNALSIEETRQAYIRTADSCQSFIEECTTIDLDPKIYVRDDVLYQLYVTYCQTNKLPTQRKGQLTQAMSRCRPEAEHINQRINNKVVRVWRFVATVATVATPTLIDNFKNQNIEKREAPATPATSATNSPEPTSSPNEEVKNHALVRGAIAVLNGPISVNLLTVEPAIANAKVEPTGPNGPVEERTCGKCLLWHKPGCTFPDSEYTCVAPTNKYAVDCRDFMEKEGSS